MNYAVATEEIGMITPAQLDAYLGK